MNETEHVLTLGVWHLDAVDVPTGNVHPARGMSSLSDRF